MRKTAKFIQCRAKNYKANRHISPVYNLQASRLNGNYISHKVNFLMTGGILNTGAKIVKLAVLGLFATDVLIAANVRNKIIFMKKAVIKVGGKQYVVAEKETLLVDLLPEGTKDLALDALLVIDGDKTTVGEPTVKGVKVKAKVVEEKVAGEKLRVIRYHSKKRVHKEIGHRQKYTKIEIVSIA